MRQEQRKSKAAAAVLFEALEGRAHFSATITGLVHNDLNGDRRLNEFATTPATRVYVDANKNGRRDAGELSTVTDSNGRYALTNVPPGSQIIRFELPAGWAPTNATAHVGQPVIFTGSTKSITVKDALIRYASAPWQTVGQNGQHTGVSPFRGGPLTGSPFEVTTENDPKVLLTVSDAGDKFGTPLFTKYNTVIVSVFDSTTEKFAVRAFSRAGGAQLWTFVSDYVLPPSAPDTARGRAAAFQPALGPDGKLYVPGAGGTVYVINAPDQFSRTRDRVRTTDKQVAFYGIENYRGEKAGKFRGHVFINTPLTVAPNGDVYFGVETSGTNPLGLTSSLARVRANGTGGRVAGAVVTGSAPALSANGAYVYVTTQSGGTAQVERFRAVSLRRAGSQVLVDRQNKQKVQLTPAAVAVPVVAPDGDVYLAVPARATEVAAKGNGWLMRFSGDLKKVKATQAQVVGDATPSIVPASMVAGYRGKSAYVVAAVRFVPLTQTLTVTDPGQEDVPEAQRTTHEFVATLPDQRLALFDPGASLDRVGGEYLLSAFQLGSDKDTGDPIFAAAFASAPVTVDVSGGVIYLVDSAGQLHRWGVADVRQVTAPVSVSTALPNNGPVLDEGGNPAVIGPDGVVYVIATTRDQLGKSKGHLFAIF